ncbi:MAG: radical SAM protein [Anaerolineae bacterium]|nr:radical SAM protein [Anaerolineae bacterium]
MTTYTESILAATESVCPECLARIPAFHIRRGADVYLTKACEEHGVFETIIWRGEPAYETWIRPKLPTTPEKPLTTVERGCPFDCGLCPDHRQQTCTALLEVTQRCNLYCAFCFASSGSNVADPDLATIEGWYRSLLRSGGPCNVQLSGGEPTLRDDLPDIVALGRDLGFDFIQVNTNGLRLARDPDYVAALKEAGLASIFLQFDGTDDAIYTKLRGRPILAEKEAAIAACAAHGLGVILVPTLVPGINTHALGDIVRFALAHAPVVRGVHFQPVSYFGRTPSAPEVRFRDDAARITIPEVIRALEAQTEGLVKAAQFIPPGCENALCSFHGNFVILADGRLFGWTHHQPKTCGCQPKPAEEGAAEARSFVAHQWTAPEPISTSGGPSLGGWDELLERAKTYTFCISGMAFQDAWTLDLERLRDCCIHVVAPDGRIVPFCAYNLTARDGRALYRSRE